MTPSTMLLAMMVPALLLLAEATRRGLGRMMSALGFMGAWLGLTAVASRATNQFEAAEAVRNYAVAMVALSFLYFRGKPRPAKKEATPSEQVPTAVTPEV
jgi:hypothetical protein